MKQAYTFFILTFAFVSIQAQSTYQQLCDLNKYWAVNAVASNEFSTAGHFENHTELIQFHLKKVERLLRTKSTDHLSPSQRANRQVGLNILKKYWTAKQFPINTRHSYTIPYFIDDFNTACAVGHIMLESGAADLACTIANEDNNAYLEDMNFKEIEAWATVMGFEIAELKWIQPSYPPTLTIAPEVVSPTCGYNNGAIDVTISSSGFGSPTIDPTNLVYDWEVLSSNTDFSGSDAEDLNELPAGLYKLNVSLNGSVSTANSFIPLNDEGTASFVATETMPVCPNAAEGSIELEMTGGAAPFTFHWYDAQGNIVSTEQNAYNLFGIQFGALPWGALPYSHHVEITDANGCKSYGSFALYHTNWGINFLVATNDIVHACPQEANGSINLSNVTGSALSFEWSDGNTEQVRTGLEAGIYTVTVTDSFGCTDQKSFTVQEVNNLLVIQNNLNCTAGEIYDLEFSVSGGNANFGEYTIVADNYEIEALGNGKYLLLDIPTNEAITIEITGINDCTVSKTLNVAQSAEFWITDALTYCESVLLAAPVPGDYIWSTGETDGAIWVTESGSYALNVEMESGCTVSDVITLNILEVQAGFDYVQEGLTVHFQNTSTNADTYFWVFGNGQASTLAHPSVTFDAPGIYEVSLLANGFPLCPSGGVTQYIEVLATGIETSAQNANFALYPNPNTGSFQVEIAAEWFYKKGNDFQIILMDMLGKTILHQNIPYQQTNIQLNDVATGIYIVTLTNGQQTWVEKMVIK